MRTGPVALAIDVVYTLSIRYLNSRREQLMLHGYKLVANWMCTMRLSFCCIGQSQSWRAMLGLTINFFFFQIITCVPMLPVM
jgi:hypothetical protein